MNSLAITKFMNHSKCLHQNSIVTVCLPHLPPCSKFPFHTPCPWMKLGRCIMPKEIPFDFFPYKLLNAQSSKLRLNYPPRSPNVSGCVFQSSSFIWCTWDLSCFNFIQIAGGSFTALFPCDNHEAFLLFSSYLLEFFPDTRACTVSDSFHIKATWKNNFSFSFDSKPHIILTPWDGSIAITFGPITTNDWGLPKTKRIYHLPLLAPFCRRNLILCL